MPSNARKSFDENLVDIGRLIDFHQVAELLEKEADPNDSPVAGKDVVLRSAIVLLVTYWEAYLEDIASEAINLIVDKVIVPEKLPKDLKKAVLKDLENDTNELACWQLAGDGWKKLLHDRLPKLQEARNRSFNTPKSRQTREFISAALGIADVTKAWEFAGRTPEENAAKLDALVETRGRIAHRGKLTKKITEKGVSEATEFIKSLVSKTGGKINTEVKKIAGVSLLKENK
ncbi:MAG: hypothetical protein JNK37_05780 [Verrucomicrobiales bacterium]|nr:hypothetical protein [Verrucomicrobiales bacterium]